MNEHRFSSLIAALCLGLSAAAPLNLAARHWGDEDHTYDRARRAVEQGEIKPITELLELLQQQQPGDVIEVEFEREHGVWVYEFKVIAPDGRLLEIYMDAYTGEMLYIGED